jgi:hypothetical protein
MTHLDRLHREFHNVKNLPHDLSDFKPQSNKKVWWKCSINPLHEWQASICNRNKGTGCPMCSGRIIDPTNNLSVKYPSLANEWHPTKNTVSAEKVAAGSNKSVWWRCSKNLEHEWQAAPNTRVKGTGCPHCTGRTTFGGNTVQGKYPHLISEWDVQKNTGVDPSQICPGSDKKVWWICPEKQHSYQTKISNRTIHSTRCPICTNRKVISENCLELLFPAIAKEWHPTKNLPLHPSSVLPNHSKQVWWKCEKGHEWSATPTNRTRFSNQCPGCSGRVASPENNLLVKYPAIAAEWHPTKNNEKKPEEFTPSAHHKAWWQCHKFQDHIYTSSIGNRTMKNGRGTGCPFCNQSKMEKVTEDCLREIFVSVEPQKKFRDLRFHKNKLSYDFYLPEFNAAIECDGRQHFEEASDYFHHQKSYSHQRLRDVVKNAYAAREGIALLRIAYTEENYIPTLIETFVNRLKRGERPFNLVGRPYKDLFSK